MTHRRAVAILVASLLLFCDVTVKSRVIRYTGHFNSPIRYTVGHSNTPISSESQTDDVEISPEHDDWSIYGNDVTERENLNQYDPPSDLVYNLADQIVLNQRHHRQDEEAGYNMSPPRQTVVRRSNVASSQYNVFTEGGSEPPVYEDRVVTSPIHLQRRSNSLLGLDNVDFIVSTLDEARGSGGGGSAGAGGGHYPSIGDVPLLEEDPRNSHGSSFARSRSRANGFSSLRNRSYSSVGGGGGSDPSGHVDSTGMKLTSARSNQRRLNANVDPEQLRRLVAELRHSGRR